MKMPWTVRVVKWWFALLAVASFAPIVYFACYWVVEGEEASNIIFELLASLSILTLGIGFLTGICRGLRHGVEVPYSMAGTVAAVGVLRIVGSMWLLSGVATATILPLVLLHLPASNRWFEEVGSPKECGMGCCALAVLVVCIVVWPMFYVPRSRSAHQAVLAMRGHRVFAELLVMNETERAVGGTWVDPNICSNSCEYVERLCAQFGKDANVDAVRVGREWSFAVNVPVDAPDTFPLMVSANVTPRIVPRVWDGVTGKDESVELKPLEGIDTLPKIGTKAVVVVRKGGAAQVVKRKYASRRFLLGEHPYKLGDDFYYLTPVGRATCE